MKRAARRTSRRSAAWQALETAQAQIVSFQEQVRATDIALEGVRQEQSVGARTVLDVLDAEQESLNAKVNLVTAQTNLVVARYQVLQAIGPLEREGSRTERAALRSGQALQRRCATSGGAPEIR